MKTIEMKMTALQDAKERAFILQNNIISYSQQLAIYGAMMSDYEMETMFDCIERMKVQYKQLCTLISFYERELRCKS